MELCYGLMTLIEHRQSHLKSHSRVLLLILKVSDSLQPELVIEALNTAMAECRLDWSDGFKE